MKEKRTRLETISNVTELVVDVLFYSIALVPIIMIAAVLIYNKITGHII